MLRRMLAVALAAGILSGLAISAVQQVTTTPLILAAEVYEGAAATSPAHGIHAHADSAGGLERALLTTAANVVAGVGFALLLVAAFAVHGRAVGARGGLAWGAAGFAVFALAPGLGLPPELPGTAAAGLAARQAWWAFAAASTALGLGLLVFGRRRAVLVALGLLALVLPHAVGAPHPADSSGGGVPPELAARFVAASLAVAAAFWLLLGASSGALYRRLVGPEGAAGPRLSGAAPRP